MRAAKHASERLFVLCACMHAFMGMCMYDMGGRGGGCNIYMACIDIDSSMYLKIELSVLQLAIQQ